MTIAASVPIARAQRNLAPLCVAAASFLLLLVNGDSLDRLLFVDAPG
jgi:hypothetical protein